MRHSLTVCFVTSRLDSKIDWFFDSLAKQINEGDEIRIIVVDFHLSDPQRFSSKRFPKEFPHLRYVEPKPTIWKGAHRITRENWWSKSNDLNSSICLCETEWWSWVDDRCVLAPGWLDSVRRAMDGDYAVCGSYEKHAGLIVENGEVRGSAQLLGADTRTPGCYDFDSWYGGSGALPLEWCLAVNGFAELTDSLGSEDSMFGVTLRNSGYPIRYDSQMRLIEDRTPGQIDGALKRADKNSHLGQQAKSWAIVRAFHGKTTSQNEFDIRNLRDRVLLNGESLDSIGPFGSDTDWYDQQKISEME